MKINKVKDAEAYLGKRIEIKECKKKATGVSRWWVDEDTIV